MAKSAVQKLSVSGNHVLKAGVFNQYTAQGFRYKGCFKICDKEYFL